jgi:DNA-binding transcriptional ArsR family regulator
VRPTLLKALFPKVRAEVLRLLFTNPGQELYVRQLARLSSLTLHTIQDELAKLARARLVLSRSNGYHRFYRANPRHPLYSTLRRLVIKSALLAGPQRVRPRLRRSSCVRKRDPLQHPTFLTSMSIHRKPF